MPNSLLTPDSFEFLARFVLAGYVVILVRSAFVLGLRPKPAELLLEAILFSIIVQALLVVIIAPLLTWGFNLNSGVQIAPELQLFLEVGILPACLGLFLGWFLRSGIRNLLLRRLAMPIVHPVRRAHDFAFGNDRSEGLVEITFADGQKIAGWFGNKSLAASDDQRTDLYLERVYLINDQGDWMEASPERSALIKLADVRYIEFLDTVEENDDG